MSWFSSFAEKVQSVLPPTSGDILNALTLNTAEMTAEREQMELEDRRKEAFKDSLSALLPWETNDEERAILVEECREAILGLSTREETFLGDVVTHSVSGSRIGQLPNLLEHFDLDAHVGLIRRMFDVDPNLVEMHANLSGTYCRSTLFPDSRWKLCFLRLLMVICLPFCHVQQTNFRTAQQKVLQ